MRRFTAADYLRVHAGDMSAEEIQAWIDELLDELRSAPDPTSAEYDDHEMFIIVLLDQLGQKIEAKEQEIERMRTVLSQAKEDVAVLLESPTETWTAIRDARPGRFRSRAFAMQLLTEAETRLDTDPDEAKALAAFVAVALVWAGADRPWAEELRTRAASLRDRARSLVSQRHSIH